MVKSSQAEMDNNFMPRALVLIGFGLMALRVTISYWARRTKPLST
jgi:hypothetical protein